MRTKPELTQSTYQPRDGNGDLGFTSVVYQLSGPVTTLVGSAFLSGVWYGLAEFLQRSPVRRVHVAGTAAWGEQLALVVAAVVIVSIAETRHRRRFGPRSPRPWLLAPFGRHAAQRIGRSLGFGGGRAQPGRLLLALPAAALFLFCFWRAGVQLTAGLDPNFTVNAWGGPSYAGALACHYLDLFLLSAGAAWLVDKVLPA